MNEEILQKLIDILERLTKLLEEMAGPYCGHGERFNICPWCKALPDYPFGAIK